MRKSDLVDKILENVGFSRKEAAEIVETTLEIIKETLERGENVKISGFGSFVILQKKARRGRNPQTGEDLFITPRKVLTFRPSRILRNALNVGK